MKEEIQNRLLAYSEKLVKTRVVDCNIFIIWGLQLASEIQGYIGL